MADRLDPNRRWFKLVLCTVALASIGAVGYWELTRDWSSSPPNKVVRPFWIAEDEEITLDQKQRFGLFDTRPQRYAFRIVLLSMASLVVLLAAGILRPRYPVALLALSNDLRSFLWRKRRSLNRWIGVGLLLTLLALTLPALRKIPDFSAGDASRMAITNMHMTITFGHTDRLAQGDVLFRDTTPNYGALLPVFLGAVERQHGVFPLGTVYRIKMLVEIVFLVGAAWLFLRWGRGYWLLCLLPFFLVLPWYYSVGTILVPTNHSVWRLLGIPLGLFTLYLLRSAAPARLQYACGALCSLAILINFESGVAATAGVLAFAFFRYGPGGDNVNGGSRLRMGNWLRTGIRIFVGGAAVLIAFALFCRLALGAFPDLDGLARYYRCVLLAAGGLFSFEYYGTLWQAVIWPLVMLVHVSAVLLYTALSRPYGFRQSFRAAVCTMFLVWFTYYVNRPHIVYLCSYWFLYGLILIDSGRFLRVAIRRPQRFRGVEVAVVVLLFLIVGKIGYQSINWTYHPLNWEVQSERWTEPLVWKGKPTKEPAAYASKVYLPMAYASELQQRADFLRRKSQEAGRRVVYFTVDSYLIPRFAGMSSWQEYIDPVEAPDRPAYQRLVDSVLHSNHPEVYVDSRDAGKLIFYWEVFILLRKDLGQAYRLDRIEEGWEVWVLKDSPGP